MMRQLLTWQLVLESLRKEIPVMLLYVLESKGSSPGRQGFFMAVNGNSDMEGSIGGGIMEHKFVEMAKERLKAHGAGHKELRKQFHDKSATKDQSGMICSGEQTILLLPVYRDNLNTIENIVRSLEKFENGTLMLSPAGMDFKDEAPLGDFEFIFKTGSDWSYRERTGYKNQLSIIGGGHCGLALSKLMHGMDFFIRVYDDREHLNTMRANVWAHEKIFVRDYSELKNIIEPGGSHYVVIMTFGYRTDDLAMRALFDKQFKYLGLLGSQSKISKMMEDYRKEGVPDALLKNVNTPIGVPIKSQTPEEIAVSIAAEIISIKNRDL